MITDRDGRVTEHSKAGVSSGVVIKMHLRVPTIHTYVHVTVKARRLVILGFTGKS
jgi:hypothetical protein